MRFGTSGAAALAVLAFTGEAHATPPQARLLYARGDGTETCPDASALRDAVTMRLGYDPFRADATATIEARVERRADDLHADVRMYDATGALTGERELTARGTDCAPLASAMTLTISILVDPHGLGRKAEEAPAPALPPPEPRPGGTFDTADVHDSPFEHAAPTPPPPPEERIVLRTGLGGLVSVGAAPAVAAGVAAFVGLARARWAVDLEGRVDLPASSKAGDGSAVRSSLSVGGVVPCYAAGIFRACAVGLFGVLRGEGIGVAGRDRDQTFYAAAGTRLEVAPSIGAGFVVRAHADGLAPLVHTKLRVLDREAVWTTPPVFLTVGLGLAKNFR